MSPAHSGTSLDSVAVDRNRGGQWPPAYQYPGGSVDAEEDTGKRADGRLDVRHLRLHAAGIAPATWIIGLNVRLA